MTKYLAAVVALVALPQVAAAQNLPAPVIAVVDSNKAANDCNACRTALAALQQQQQAIQTFRNQQAAPLQTEEQQLQTAVDALKGKQPDAALQARITAFQTKAQQAQQQYTQRAQGFERNRNHVMKQISDRLRPAIEAVQARRRATLVVDAGSVIKFAPALDVTNDVVAELNRTLTTISTTAPAQQQQQTPQGR